MDAGIRMHAERTPNPNSIKWVLSSTVVEGSASAYFAQPPLPDQSPLAAALFRVHGVEGRIQGPGGRGPTLHLGEDLYP